MSDLKIKNAICRLVWAGSHRGGAIPCGGDSGCGDCAERRVCEACGWWLSAGLPSRMLATWIGSVLKLLA
jgi:hypothetical protein